MRTPLCVAICIYVFAFPILNGQDSFENSRDGYLIWPPTDSLLVGPSDNIDETNGIPECPIPAGVTIMKSETFRATISWTDIAAQESDTRYQIRYRSNRGWKKVYAYVGNSKDIELEDPFESYEFQIRKLCGGKGRKFVMASSWLKLTNEYLRSPIDCNQLANIQPTLFGQDSIRFMLTYTQLQYLNSLNLCLGVYITYCDDTIPEFVDHFCPTTNQSSYTFSLSGDRGANNPSGSGSNNICDISYVAITLGGNPPNGTQPGVWNPSTNQGMTRVGIFAQGVCPSTSIYTINGPGGQITSCPENYDIPEATGDVQLAQASVGEVFIIYGLPIVLTAVTGNDGIFSGRGSVILPFQGKTLDVSFDEIKVNDEYVVYDGQVVGLPGNPDDYPDLSGGITVSTDYCVDLGESDLGTFDDNGINSATGLPWNPLGFGPNGTYDQIPPYPGYTEGDPLDSNFDPNGFDANGNHKETGTLYNPNGCDQLGLDMNGQPCNPNGDCPYYWLTNCVGQTDEGVHFADSISDELSGIIQDILSMIQTENNDSITIKSSHCNSLREDMDKLIEMLEYDRKFVFGIDDIYFTKGMSVHFEQRPIPFQTSISDRNIETEELENKHVALYGCDQKQLIFEELGTIIQAHLAGDKIAEIKNILIELIKRMDAATIHSFQTNTEALPNWIKTELQKLLGEAFNASQNQDTGFLNRGFPKENNSLPMPGSDYSNLVSSNRIVSNETYHPTTHSVDFKMYHQFISEELSNGKKYINNIHKAFYLEAALHKRRMNRSNLNLNNEENLLPISVSKEILGLEYTIILDQIILHPTTAFVDAFLIIEDPNSGQKIVFEGYQIPFGPGGLSDENSVLSLASDVEMKLANNVLLRILGTGNTFASWNCSGFTGMGIEAEIEFCRQMLIPLHPQTMQPIADENEFVLAHFLATMPAWGEFMAEISIDPFAVKGAEQIGWTVNQAQIDFSDLGSFDFVTPELYQSPHLNPDGTVMNSWKGFHLAEISATLPRKFQSSGNGESITVGAQNLIIDQRGFTGQLFVGGNILTLDQGNADGWAFSIDTFKVDIINNHLTGGGMSGLINVPLMKGKNNTNENVTNADCLEYRAYMQAGNVLSFDVSPKDDFEIPIWKADLTLRADSKLEMQYKNDSFKILATLHGDISVNANLTENIGATISGVHFENVQLSNLDPYFSPGTWSMPGEIGAQFAGFKLGVKKIGLFKDTTENSISLNFNGLIKITGDSLGIGAEGKFRLTGDLQESDGRQKWKFTDFHVDGLSIDATIKGTTIKGGLVFYGKDNPDPTYGSGFRGVLGVQFTKINAAVAAIAQFGQKDDYKYFMIDALASLNPGIQFGMLKLHGFGGGLYHRMAPTDNTAYNLALAPGTLPNLNALELGKSISNVTYVPDDSKGLGLKAIVLISTESDNVFNASAQFEILFNASDHGGGIAEISLKGNGQLMSEIDMSLNPSFNPGVKPISVAVLSANVDLTLDFNNDVFDGQLEVYLNAGPLKGTGTDGKLVDAVIHFAQDEWYINIGEPHPDKRAGVKLLIAEVKAYLCVGTNIPEMPPLPDNVKQLTRHFSPQNQLRNTGRGFAFGASLDVHTGERNFLIFYGEFDLTLGFDVLIKDYGPNAICQSTGQTVGINGWYASGQIYAYVGGKIGIKALGKKYEIINLALAAVLEARLPNPLWAAGTVGGRYRILGGLIKGECRFHFEIGERCIIVGTENPEEEQEIILSLTPHDGNRDMSSTTIPEIAFAVPLDKPYEVQNLNGEGMTQYVAKLKSIELFKDKNEISGELKWIKDEGFNDKLYAQYVPKNFLPGGDSVTIRAEIELFREGESIKTEVRKNIFYTSPRPNNIPQDNIVATYPVHGMNNFYKEEWSQQKGYILLRIGQMYLFTGESKPEVRLYDENDQYHSLDYEYKPYNNEISFDLPSSLLENNHVYRIKVVGTDIESATGNSSSDSNLPGYGPADPSHTTHNSNRNSSEQVLLEIVFGVSEFNRLRDKLDYVKDNLSVYVVGLGKKYKVSLDEGFDDIEISGEINDPLLNFEFLSSNNNWLVSKHNLIHERLPDNLYYDVILDSDKHDLIGNVAQDAFKATATSISRIDTSEPIGPRGNAATGSIIFSVSIGEKVDQAFKDIRDQFLEFYSHFDSESNDVYDHDPPPKTPWVQQFESYTDGFYINSQGLEFRVNYTLPGKSTTTTDYKISL